MSSNPETFVKHMWPWIAHTLTGHVLAMAREGLIGQDMGETLAGAIDRVRDQPAADEDLVSLVRSYEQLLAAQLTPELEAAARVGRSIVDITATVARLATLERLNALDLEVRRCEAATLALAERNYVTLMPVTMDGFVSQPTSVAHWLGAVDRAAWPRPGSDCRGDRDGRCQSDGRQRTGLERVRRRSICHRG